MNTPTLPPKTFGELFRALEKVYKVTIITRRIIGPRGAVLQRYIERTMLDPNYGGEIKLEHPIAAKNDTEGFPQQVAKSLCRNLSIPPEDFGYR